MLDIISFIPGRKKQSPSGWVSFNAVCCHHRGNSQDKRGRGGIKTESDGSWVHHCFNCGFKANFTLGRPLSRNAKQLLQWLGVDELTIERVSLESLRHKSITDLLSSKVVSRWQPKFKKQQLPDGLQLIDDSNIGHKKYVDYLVGRSVEYDKYPFMVIPNGPGREKNKIVIPFTHDNQLVGYCSRYLDNRTPKYINHTQPGYVFGTDLQKPDWDIVFVVEGVFDAIAINGLAILHGDVSEKQVDLIKGLDKRVIVVPDRDKAGGKLITRAIELGWAVSFPDWDADIKDANDAVHRYGKLATIISIVDSVETSKIKIELRRKKSC